jgi:hypothetical protein
MIANILRLDAGFRNIGGGKGVTDFRIGLEGDGTADTKTQRNGGATEVFYRQNWELFYLS